jgi:hypothetical protein
MEGIIGEDNVDEQSKRKRVVCYWLVTFPHSPYLSCNFASPTVNSIYWYDYNSFSYIYEVVLAFQYASVLLSVILLTLH